MKAKCRTAILAALLLAFFLAACGSDNKAATMHLVKTEGKV